MTKFIHAILCVLTLTLCPMDYVSAQGDDLPYDPFIDKQLEMQGRTKENKAMRDLGGAQMATVVGVPAEVKNELRVTKKVNAVGQKPIIILVYGRKQILPAETAVSEELQRKEVERVAFKEGLRGDNYAVASPVRRDSAGPPQIQPK
jgi:hypothetical protein